MRNRPAKPPAAGRPSKPSRSAGGAACRPEAARCVLTAQLLPAFYGRRAAKVRFWVTMCPRTSTRLGREHQFEQPTDRFPDRRPERAGRTVDRRRAANHLTGPNPAAAASWRTLRAVNQVS